MDTHLAELSRSIDPAELGRRIRNARVAAGMTQTQVVADDVSPAYLSRIEDGQRRPEAGLLERMATRMGTTLEALLLDISTDRSRELRLGIDHAELALVAGQHADALARANQLLDDTDVGKFPELQRALLRVKAGALEANGDLNEAISILEELTSAPTPDSNWLRELIALSRCYRDIGEFKRAIAVGEEAQTKIDELELAGFTEAIQLTVTVAGAYYRQGDNVQAMAVCGRALREAEKYDSPIAKASAYWNASSIEAATNGATATAIDMAQKALALFELGEDNRNLAKLRAEVANLQLAQEPADAAGALETLALADRELSWSGASAWEIALLHLTRGRAHLLLGNHQEAVENVELGLAVAPENASFLHASAASIQGQVAAAAGRTEEARDRYRTAIYALTAAGADRGVAQLWFELANLLTEIGDTEGALQAFRSAGASTGLRVQVGTAAQIDVTATS